VNTVCFVCSNFCHLNTPLQVAVSIAETIKLSVIQGVSKILGQSSGVSSPYRNEEKSSYECTFTSTYF
jgi:hypothetical protein